MTLHSSRDGQKITIHGNLGLTAHVRNGQVSEFHIDDPAGLEHVRSFWGGLGRHLEDADREREERAAEHEAVAENHGHPGS